MMRFLFALLLFTLPAAAQIMPVDRDIKVTVGPLIDDTDFKTLETAIAYNATGMSVDLIVSSGTGAGVKTDLTLTTGSTQDWTHLGNGIYEIEIAASQNDTEGSLQVVGVCDGVLPFFSPVYTVVAANIRDSLVDGSDYLQTDAVQIEGSDATNAINAEADTALSDYDPPTNTELNARTLAAASYFDPATDTVANVTTVATLTGHTPQTADHTANIAAILADTAAVDTQSELRTILVGSDTALATGSAVATAQADLDILTGTDGVTLATSQPNYAPYTGTPPTVGQIRAEMETAGGHLASILADTGTDIPATLSGLATSAALSTHDSKLDTVDGIVDSILADTAAVDTQAELRTLLVGSDTALATATAISSAQADITSILGDTTELQTRFGAMVEADGGDWRFDANSLEQAPGGGSGGDATAANQTAILDRLAGIMDKDHTLAAAVGDFDPASHSLEALRIRGDAAWTTGGAGAGAVTFTYNLTDSVSGNPIDDVLVEVFTEVGMTNRVASGRTDAFGNVTFDLDAGTYYIKRSKGGYTFTNPDSESVTE